MQTVSKQNIDKWLHENQYTYGNLALKKEDKPNQPRPRQTKQAMKSPWYQRTPRTWFRPIFAALLFIRQRWEAFALVGVLAIVFGLCWWMTCLWLG